MLAGVLGVPSENNSYSAHASLLTLSEESRRVCVATAASEGESKGARLTNDRVPSMDLFNDLWGADSTSMKRSLTEEMGVEDLTGGPLSPLVDGNAAKRRKTGSVGPAQEQTEERPQCSLAVSEALKLVSSAVGQHYLQIPANLAIDSPQQLQVPRDWTEAVRPARVAVLEAEGLNKSTRHSAASRSTITDRNDVPVPRDVTMATVQPKVGAPEDRGRPPAAARGAQNGATYLLNNGDLPPCPPGKHQCIQCGKLFGQQGNLTTHIKIVHQKQKDHRCTYCGKLFSVKTSMRNHMRSVHEGRRDFQCLVCLADGVVKTFTEAGSLRRHVRSVHEGRRDHICSKCNKGFPERSALKKHMLSRHNVATAAS